MPHEGWERLLLSAVMVAVLFFVPSTRSAAQNSGDDFSNHGLGNIPSKKSELEKIPIAPRYRAFVPERFDLSDKMPLPDYEGQMQIGSCTAWAIAYEARSYYVRTVEGLNNRNPSNIPSPAYLYNSRLDRSHQESKKCNWGLAIASTLDSLETRGVLSLREYPTLSNACPVPPSSEEHRAVGFRISSHYQIGTRELKLDDIKGALVQGDPVIIALALYYPDGFDKSGPFDRLTAGRIFRLAIAPVRDADNYIRWDDQFTKRHFQPHAMTVVGYDDQRNAFKLMNSWGRKWADQGFAWVDYDTFERNLTEAHIMRVTPPPPAVPTCSLSISPESIVRGDTAVLSYTSQNATEGAIDNGIGGVPANGSMTITPAKSEHYSASFFGSGGNVTCTAAVTVTEPVPKPDLPAIASFSASPSQIAAGESVKLVWSVKKATSIKLDHGIGIVKEMPISVSPESTTTYRLTATNDAGAVTSNVVVRVLPSEPIVLPDVGCGRVAIVDHAGKPSVVGFVGKDEDLDKIRAAAKGAQVDVDVRPFPQCEALLTLEKALSRPDRPRVSIRKPTGDVLIAGNDLVFEIETPSYPSFLHVAYVQADDSGHYNVVNLIQPGVGSLTAYPPNTKLVLGNDPGARRFRVSPPFGREMLVVLAARSPIFPERRPDKETEREFLTALRRVLIAKPDAAATDRDVVAGYDTIITAERKTP